MSLIFPLKGLLIGLVVAAGVGPVSLLCIQRTLSMGRREGLLIGLGAALADGVYGAVAAFGIVAVADALVVHQDGLKLAGGALLAWLGGRTMLRAGAPGEVAETPEVKAAAGTVLALFLFTLTNPTTIATFAAIFAGAGLLVADARAGDAGLMVLGVFGGSMLWWVLLTAVVERLRPRLDDRLLRWVNLSAGGLLLIIGLALGASAAVKLLAS